LLGIGRADTETACRVEGLVPWQDPHNADPAFTRVRLRREVLPLLDEVLAGGVRPALARTACLMAQDLDALDQIAAAVSAVVLRADGAIDIPALAGQPAAVFGRVLRTWALAGGAASLSHGQLSRMIAQVNARSGPQQVRIGGSLDVWRRGERLVLERIP
jgi:tRNA(Ile)-lysidine synthase